MASSSTVSPGLVGVAAVVTGTEKLFARTIAPVTFAMWRAGSHRFVDVKRTSGP